MRFYIEERDNGLTWVRLTRESQPQIYEISQWCAKHQCGKQVNIHTVSFKNKDELTMFLLRWQDSDA